MTSDEERLILAFLRTRPESFFSAAEICRRAAGRKLYQENPRWAYAALANLLHKGLVECDSAAHFRFMKGVFG
jgi:hypothetical protein